jgi:hypothetical protein
LWSVGQPLGGGDDLGCGDAQQARIGPVREGVAGAAGPQRNMLRTLWWRPPVLGGHRAETHHRRRAVGGGEMGDAGITTHDQRCLGDRGGELGQRGAAGEHRFVGQAGRGG